MQRILTQLEKEPLPRVILVHGPEVFWQERVFTILQERNAKDPMGEWNWSVFHGSKEFDLEPFLAELGMVSWGDNPRIVVLREGGLIPAGVMDTIATWLEEHPQSNILAIFLDKVDNRWKYLKTLRKFALEIECKPLQGEALVRYVLDYSLEQAKKMGRPTAELFLDLVGADLLTIHNELDKLVNYTEGREEITVKDLQAITSLSPAQIENHTIFQMTDLIVQKKRQEALEVLNSLLSAGEPPMRILPLIERQLRLVLAAKTSTTRPEETARQMGENSAYPLKKIQPYVKNFSLEEILAHFKAVVSADREMKLGTPGDQVLVDLIIKLTA